MFHSKTLIFKNIPQDLQEALFKEFGEIKRRYSLNDWGPGELNAGRFAEAVLRIFQYLLGDQPTPFGVEIKPRDKDQIINRVVSHPTVDEHVRQKVTSLTRLLLDFRNNRDVAHIGGFDANQMDTYITMASSSWVMAELIRVYGNYSMGDAQNIVASITVKDYPSIFEIDGEVYVSRNDLSAMDEALLLLYKNGGLGFDILNAKTKDKNKARFKKAIDEMAREKLVVCKDNKYYIMPLGSKRVEEEGFLHFA
jgi:hypothetical protein